MSAGRRFLGSAVGAARRRVVVTGVGAVSPVGCSVKESWANVRQGKSGVRALPDDLYGRFPCRIAAQVNRTDLNIDKHIAKGDLRSMSPATVFAMIATAEALQSAQWTPTDERSLLETGVAIGVGMIDLEDVRQSQAALEKSYNRLSPFFVPRILPNMTAGQVSMRYGFRGPNHAVSTACATGAHAIGDAFNFIRWGVDTNVMVCGGAEACISPLAIAGFCRLRALSTAFNDTPATASRPFDQQRDGFVMGEGAAIIVLEELEHARQRGAPILAEILGYGLSGDAAHLTAPREDASGAVLAMSRALRDAQLTPDAVSYVNAHATSTPIGDAVEARAIARLFADRAEPMHVSSTKGVHGHLLGAAGCLESLFTILACRDAVIPRTLNLDRPLEDVRLTHVGAESPDEWPEQQRRVALKNAFGFGGTNASLCIAAFGD